jgi:hypothetical protein
MIRSRFVAMVMLNNTLNPFRQRLNKVSKSVLEKLKVPSLQRILDVGAPGVTTVRTWGEI